MNAAFTALLALVFVGATAVASRAETTFVNRSSDDVFFATYAYEPYSSQPSVTASRFCFKGWNRLSSGEVLRTKAGWLYVKKAQSTVTWPGLKTSQGIATTDGSSFTEYVNKGFEAQEFSRLVQDGRFSQVNYTYFPDGVYEISGNAYRVATSRESFSEESRSLKFLSKSYRPGPIVTYEVSYVENSGTSVKWGVQRDNGGIYYGGSIEGRQVRPFGPREPAKFKGTVTIKYLKRD